MHIMAQRNRTPCIQAIPEQLHAGLNAIRRVVLPIQRVDAGVDDLVAQLAHRTQDEVVGGEVGGAHVRRGLADDPF